MPNRESFLDLDNKYRFVQFQLWRNCPLTCDFCYNKGIKSTNKIWSLNEIIKKFNDPIISKFNHIGLIGGEIFGKELSDTHVKELFYKLIDIINDKIKSKSVDQVYITTALLYKDTSSLEEFIQYLISSQVVDKYLLCTSYDTIYRFKNENSVELWERNMWMIRDKYPELRVHTEAIITQDLIEKVLNNEFSVSDFQRKYNTKLNFIEVQCNSNCRTKEEFDKELPRFMPKRKDFLKFMHKISKDPAVNMKEFLNEALHSDLLYMEVHGYLYEFLGRRRFPTMMDAYYRQLGRNFFHVGYIDSDVRIEDDVKVFKELNL